MRRGTTPTHTFTTDVDLSSAEVMYITYQQRSKTILEKTLDDATIEGNKVTVRLTQAETLRFSDDYASNEVKIQIRARTHDSSAWVSNVMTTTVDRLLKEGII